VSPRVLVVDDNLDLAENLVEILADAGFDAECYDDPGAALRAVAPGRYQVAIIDLCMPGMDGVELHRALKALDPGLRALAMTAFALDERVASALRDGVLGVLPKPMDAGALVQHVRRAVA